MDDLRAFSPHREQEDSQHISMFETWALGQWTEFGWKQLLSERGVGVKLSKEFQAGDKGFMVQKRHKGGRVFTNLSFQVVNEGVWAVERRSNYYWPSDIKIQLTPNLKNIQFNDIKLKKAQNLHIWEAENFIFSDQHLCENF